MLKGLMMNRPLLISSLLEYGAEVNGDVPVVSAAVEGGVHRSTYGEVARRTARLAHALVKLGIKPGDRVATLAWNGYRHLELYYAISGIGAVCHTINPRLFPEQLAYIVNHAQDRVLFFDITFAPLVAKMRKAWPKELRLVAMTDFAHRPETEGLEGTMIYEEMIGGEAESFPWPDLDENAAAGLCYTSGTTGEPKGALFTHRSNVLHTLFSIATGPKGLRNGWKILPVVPLFHVNAWGLPYAAPVVGSPIVFPGPRLDGPSLFQLMESEGVQCSWGVPTVWNFLLVEMKAKGRKPAALAEVVIGGSAAPPSMIETFERDYRINVVHGWGMTEMSPIGTMCVLPEKSEQLPFAERMKLKERQGRRMVGVEFKIVDAEGRRMPHDGVTTGQLYVRGNTIVSGYFENADASAKALDADGWFATGDVAKLTSDGYLQIVDRVKDLVKSGGEWISSIDVENLAMACPGVSQAALIGVPDAKWGERPLLIAVPTKELPASREQILAHLTARLAKWQVPDDVVFAAELPMTATGKVSKLTLRQKYGAAATG